MPACNKTVFYWTAFPDSNGHAHIDVFLHKVGKDQVVDEFFGGSDNVSPEKGYGESVYQSLTGGEYYFSTEETTLPWIIRVECQEGVAPVQRGGMDVQAVGNLVTDNYELPACQKSVFKWSMEPDSYGRILLWLNLCQDGQCYNLITD